MKASYKNWMPKKMPKIIFYISLLSLFAALIFLFLTFKNASSLYVILTIFFFVMAIFSSIFYKKFKYMEKAFDFDNKDSLSWKIINYVADNIKLESGKILDVGCGSGALSIAVAKNNPNCNILGMDKWGISYSEFSKKLCEDNAKAENIKNIEFIAGNAIKLDFEDESFDAVVSNYVYHNIPGNRQNYLLESLRVLKKGGKFAIHDLFTKTKYGNLENFTKKLSDLGFEEFKFIDTTRGEPITRDLAKATMLIGSKLLVGTK